MSKPIDLVGQRFGQRLVLERANSDSFGHSRWCCRCDCGNSTISRGDSLRRSVSCGCLRGLTVKPPSRLKHGHARGGRFSETYRSWQAMLRRCTNPNSSNYSWYGARGVKVCERWSIGEADKGGFECFLADMGERPAGKTLDRRDNDDGYHLQNCKWATRSEQMRNRRPQKKLRIKRGDPKILAGLKQYNESLARAGARP
jgi:hypothetical protein